MTSLIGKKLDSGKRLEKNQKIEKETNLYFSNSCFVQKRIPANNKKLINMGHSKILLRNGIIVVKVLIERQEKQTDIGDNNPELS